MQCRNTNKTYGSVSKFFHWLIVIIFLLQVIVGATMDDVPNKFLRSDIFIFHKSLGLTLLFVMILFIAWTISSKKPKWPVEMAAWERLFARTTQILLYLSLLLLPITGWWMSTASGHPPRFYWLFAWPMPGVSLNKPLARFFGGWHTNLVWIASSLIIIHVVGALKHHFVNNDDVLRNMLPRYFNKENKEVVEQKEAP